MCLALRLRLLSLGCGYPEEFNTTFKASFVNTLGSSCIHVAVSVLGVFDEAQFLGAVSLAFTKVNHWHLSQPPNR